MKKLFLVASILVLTAIQTPAQFTSTYGTLSTSLSTSSTGVVTGTPFAIQATYSSLISWQVVADGSALSVNLECSLDNSTYFIVDSITTASGALKNFGFSAVKFCRISQVSRTGGTLTTGTFVVTRGFITGGAFNAASGQILLSDGSSALPAIAFLSAPKVGWYKSGPNAWTFTTSSATKSFSFNSDNGVFGLHPSIPVSWGVTTAETGYDTNLGRIGPGQIYAGTATSQSVINGTLFTYSGAAVCTAADLVETTAITYTLPASALNANGRMLRVTAWGTGAANVNTKTFKVYFGASVPVTGAISTSGAFWRAIYYITRTGAATQNTWGEFIQSGNSSAYGAFTATETLANAIIIKTTIQNGVATAGDICGTNMIVETIK